MSSLIADDLRAGPGRDRNRAHPAASRAVQAGDPANRRAGAGPAGETSTRTSRCVRTPIGPPQPAKSGRPGPAAFLGGDPSRRLGSPQSEGARVKLHGRRLTPIPPGRPRCGPAAAGGDDDRASARKGRIRTRDTRTVVRYKGSCSAHRSTGARFRNSRSAGEEPHARLGRRTFCASTAAAGRRWRWPVATPRLFGT